LVMLMSTEPLSGRELIEQTFMPEDVPDERLYRRLKITAAGMLRSMMGEGDERPEDQQRAERRGASRLYANTRVDPDRLCRRAQECTVEAIKQLPRVLVAHDTVEFDLHGRYEPDDAGPLRSSNSCGYLLHHGVVLDPNNDARIGILYQHPWTRQYPEGTRPADKIRVRKMWKNENYKWSKGVEQAHKALKEFGFEGRARHLFDHEGSSYASLAKLKYRKRDCGARTQVDRNIAEGNGKLNAYMAEQPVAACWEVPIEEDPSAKARGTTRRRRVAKVEMRFATVTLRPSKAYKGRLYRRGLELSVVYVNEPNPPDGHAPISWMLFCTAPVESVDDAVQVVLDYKNRWGVEDINKVLKSGCHAELAVVSDLASFRRLLAVAWPIAAHIARWTYAARVTPLEPAEPHVGSDVIEALKLACRYHGLPLPRRAWTLKDVILRLAQMGGYEPRKNRHPGWKVIWRGWRVFNNFWDHLRFLDNHRGATPHRRAPPSLRSSAVLLPEEEAADAA